MPFFYGRNKHIIEPWKGAGEPFLSVDGDYVTMWNAGYYGTVSSPEWLIIDLEMIYSIQQINLWTDDDGGIVGGGYYVEYNLYYSVDQSQWNFLYHDTLIDSVEPFDEIIMPPTQMRYIKYDVIGGSHYAHLNEMEVYEIPEPTSLLLLMMGGLLIRKRQLCNGVGK